MTARFTGKTVLVTGAGSGIGRATALAFAAEGASVVAAGRTAPSLDETVTLIEKEGGTATAVTADVTRSEDVRALVRRTVEHFGSLDVAVNNAGVFRGGSPVADLPEEDWRTLLDINVTGVCSASRPKSPGCATSPPAARSSTSPPTSVHTAALQAWPAT